ncbi:hypothetical protein [uncultured Dokdonia sp.]|uniref:hypothetical protein n=1 Tax=uncultured Dokdonia sp. TaxID=575653 RepID=UPI00262E24E8|nr:hypothetical protein [uncultured Dokdonia sp.]
MKKTILLFILLMLTSNLFSQDKKYIAFCAKDEGVGHAFVSLGKEDPEKQMTVHDGTWGMYPTNSTEGGKSIIIGEVPGGIRDDFLTKKDYTFVISQYQKLNIL